MNQHPKLTRLRAWMSSACWVVGFAVLLVSFAAPAIQELRKDLKLMERNGLIHTWTDHAITVGEPWEALIFQELNEADIVVCQLSRDFLASDFCVLKELETAIQRNQSGHAELFAYVLKDCGWKEVPNLAKFQILRDPLSEPKSA